MIQRIQTIFLFLIAAAMGAAVALPIWEKSGPRPPEMAHLSAFEYSQQTGVTTFVTPVWYLGGLMAVIAVVALYTLSQYRNRLLQTILCAVNAILLTVVMGLVLYLTLYKGKEYGSPADQGNFLPGFYGLIASLVFNALANRFIRKDEKLVKDSDRFR